MRCWDSGALAVRCTCGMAWTPNDLEWSEQLAVLAHGLDHSQFDLVHLACKVIRNVVLYEQVDVLIGERPLVVHLAVVLRATGAAYEQGRLHVRRRSNGASRTIIDSTDLVKIKCTM